jgi:DNA-binding protein HU-beta
VIEVTKAEFVAAIAKEVKISKATVEKALKAEQDILTKLLKKGDKLTLTGFISFSVGKRRARVGRNPQTGAVIKIPASKVVKFKAGNLLKNAVR